MVLPFFKEASAGGPQGGCCQGFRQAHNGASPLGMAGLGCAAQIPRLYFAQDQAVLAFMGSGCNVCDSGKNIRRVENQCR
jgi:hypothetical protein